MIEDSEMLGEEYKYTPYTKDRARGTNSIEHGNSFIHAVYRLL